MNTRHNPLTLHSTVLAAGAAAAAVMLGPRELQALGNDVVLLRANAGLIYNSNVLGVADDASQAAVQQLLGSRQKGSWMQEYGTGLHLDLPLSRQRMYLDASVTRILYDEYPELDYTSYSGQAGWDWRVGNDWFGQLSASGTEARQRTGLARGIDPPVLIRNYQATFDAHHLLTPRWEMVGSVGGSWARYDSEQLRTGDASVFRESIGALYRTPAGNSTGMRLTLEQGEWPNDVSGKSYDQHTLAAVLDWGVTGRSQLSGDIGYTWSDSSSTGDASGPSGRIAWHYAISGKTSTQLSVYQLFGPLYDPGASYVRTRGVDASLTYSATAKTSLSTYATWKTLEYRGGSTTATSPPREDDYGVVGLTAQYAATRVLSILLGGQYEKRDSNVPLTAYDVYTLYLRGQVQF